jgi:hypothetical protein
MKITKGSAGFTLIELAVYGGLLTFLCLLGFSFFTQTNSFARDLYQGNENLVKNSIVLDTVRRDLMGASMDKRLWEHEAVIFTKTFLDHKGAVVEHQVCWQSVEHGMRRIEGLYDFYRRQWGKRTFSFMGCTVCDFTIALQLDQEKKRVIQVAMSYNVSDKDHLNKKVQKISKKAVPQNNMHEVVTLRNRVIA